jgi:hypothetical protein
MTCCRLPIHQPLFRLRVWRCFLTLKRSPFSPPKPSLHSRQCGNYLSKCSRLKIHLAPPGCPSAKTVRTVSVGELDSEDEDLLISLPKGGDRERDPLDVDGKTRLGVEDLVDSEDEDLLVGRILARGDGA